jgi:16S rRNA (cytidine1402-2'-O)-methyltransferase
MEMSGTLFVVATPIGNLEDISLRALRVLREVDLVAAEDTRRTARLLAHYELAKPMTSLREHNEVRASGSLVEKLLSGQSVALVSDAGTPGIADPGAKFVRAARERGITIVAIPGPSALAAALSISGFEFDEFVFMGFPPAGGSDRTGWMERAASEPRVVVFYEAPHRIRRTVADLGARSGMRPILACRELTKIHEYSVINPIVDAWGSLPERGEYVLVMGPGAPPAKIQPDAQLASRMLGALTECAGLPDDEALRLTAAALESQPRLIAKAIKKHTISVKRQT